MPDYAEILTRHYQSRGMTDDQILQAVQAVQELAVWLHARGITMETVRVDSIRYHVAHLVASGQNTTARLLALARLFHLMHRHEIYVYFTSLFGSQDVMEAIRARIGDLEGEEAADAVFEGIKPPPLGAPLSDMPSYTQSVLTRMAEGRTEEQCAKLLAGNNHGLSRESQLGEKVFLERAGSLDRYLGERHQRQVAELQKHCDENRVWFEQIITQEVVDFVAANPEIQSAVRIGNKLFTTKIPYDTAAFLHADNPDERRYHLCHCPFIREAFKDHRAAIDPVWCNCSGGFVKFPFEVLFDTDLEVELLESPLLGHDRCRFAIRLPQEVMEQWVEE